MNIEKLNNDLAVINSYPGFERVGWNFDEPIKRIEIYGINLPQGIFNLNKINIYIRVPDNLYHPVPGKEGYCYFYTDIFIPRKLRKKGGDGKFRKIHRTHSLSILPGLDTDYVCLHPDPVPSDFNILSLIQTTLKYLITEG